MALQASAQSSLAASEGCGEVLSRGATQGKKALRTKASLIVVSIRMSTIIRVDESGADGGMAAMAPLLPEEVEEELRKSPVEAGSTDQKACVRGYC